MYTTRPLLGGGLDDIRDIWYHDMKTHIEYGRPAGYCKPCASAAARGYTARARRIAEVRAERDRVATVQQAEREAYAEDIDRTLQKAINTHWT